MLKRVILIGLAVIMSWAVAGAALALNEGEVSGKYFTLVDQNKKVIHETAMQVYVGDEYISADNSRYEVVSLSGDTAHCIYKGKERMPEVSFNPQKNAWEFQDDEIPVVGTKKPTIAVYHTHSDESYVPSDGKESINGHGGIYDVGQSLANRLKQLGFNVDYNKNNHNPHDNNAYNRSRRTVAQLLKKGPDAVVDVHRDAVPAAQYQTKVNGQSATKVKLVVGKQNPNMKTNLNFAKELKSVMDKKTPGLSNGIYLGKGDYNQDLSPRAMLIEVGSDTNSKQDAEKGVKLFADVLSTVLGTSGATTSGGAQPAAKPLTSNGQGAWTTILIILVVVAGAAAGFYWLNRGSVRK